MSPADLDLARRLGGVPGIWRAGMLGTSGIRYDATDDRGRPYRIESCAVEWPGDQPIKHVLGPRDDAPDLDDAATRGALLDVAREMWRDPSIYLAPCTEIRPDGTSPVWFVYTGRGRGPIGSAPTEGAAIALAILEAPR